MSETSPRFPQHESTRRHNGTRTRTNRTRSQTHTNLRRRELIADTTKPTLVWEKPFYPVYSYQETEIEEIRDHYAFV